MGRPSFASVVGLVTALCIAAAVMSAAGGVGLIVECPAPLVVGAAGAGGARVTYPPAAISGGTQPYRIVYSMPSGALFPIGVTSVTVTVTDASGTIAQCSFTIHVVSESVPAPSTPAPPRVVLSPDPGPVPAPAPAPAPAPSPSPSTGSYTSTKGVLQQSDITLIGVLRPAANCGTQPRGMTSRVVGGQFRLLCWSQSDGHVYEWVPGEPSTSTDFYGIPNPSSDTVRDLGTPFGQYDGFAWQVNKTSQTSTQDMKMAGIFWYEPLRQLNFIANTYYNNDYSHSTVNVGVATFDSSERLVTAGMWYTDEPSPNGVGARFTSGMTVFPDDFAAAVLGGRKLGIGFGGAFWQGIVGNNISLGPALFAMKPIDPLAQPYQAKLAQTLLPLLYHPFHNDKSVPRVARRPRYATGINKYGNPTTGAPDDAWVPDADGTQYYTTADQNAAGIWIEGPNKHGFLVFPTLAQGAAQTIVRDVRFVATSGNVSFYDLTVDSTSGFEPNMVLHLEDPNGLHYGGWQVTVIHQNNRGMYAPNLPEGNNFNPILSSTVIRVANLIDGAWNPVGSIGRRLTAGQWYGPGGPKSATSRTHVFVYDPMDLAKQALNTTGPWSELDPKYAWALPYDRRRERNIYGERPTGATAATYDAARHQLYVDVQFADLGPAYNESMPLIYVYSVSD